MLNPRYTPRYRCRQRGRGRKAAVQGAAEFQGAESAESEKGAQAERYKQGPVEAECASEESESGRKEEKPRVAEQGNGSAGLFRSHARAGTGAAEEDGHHG